MSMPERGTTEPSKPGRAAASGVSSELPEAGGEDKRLFMFAFPVLLMLGLTPLWIVTYLPMTDLPQHLALINILHNLNDPAMRFHEYFTVRAEFTPYLGYYWTVHLLAYLVPIEVANRMFLSAYVAGLAGASVWLARTLDRSRWLALFALPLAYSYLFYVGFINSLAGQALLVAALAAYGDRLQGRIRGRAWDMVLVVLPLACLATHVQPYTFFMAALAVMVVVFPGHRLSTLARCAPSFALFSCWLLRLLMNAPAGAAAPRYSVSEPLGARLAGFNQAVLDQFRDHLDTTLFVAFAALWVWGLIAALRTPIRIGFGGGEEAMGSSNALCRRARRLPLHAFAHPPDAVHQRALRAARLPPPGVVGAAGRRRGAPLMAQRFGRPVHGQFYLRRRAIRPI